MGRFATLNKNITYINELLMKNQNLCRLLYYNNFDDPLSPSHPDINTSILLGKNILPYPKSPNSIQEKNSILTCVFSGIKPTRSNFKFSDGKIVFNILCNIEKWAISEGIRPYLISEELDNIFQELRNTELSMGKVLMGDWIYREYSDTYCGYYCTYEIVNSN